MCRNAAFNERASFSQPCSPASVFSVDLHNCRTLFMPPLTSFLSCNMRETGGLCLPRTSAASLNSAAAASRNDEGSISCVDGGGNVHANKTERVCETLSPSVHAVAIFISDGVSVMPCTIRSMRVRARAPAFDSVQKTMGPGGPIAVDGRSAAPVVVVTRGCDFSGDCEAARRSIIQIWATRVN